MALKDTEYAYASAGIMAKEGQKTYSEKIMAYLDCKSVSALYDLVLSGVTSTELTQKEAIERALDEKIQTAFDTVRENAPKPEYFDFLLYEFDCCNVKTLIKCKIRGISHEGMLYSYSTVSGDEIVRGLEKRSLEGILPPHMAIATIEAIDSYNRTQDPKIIDLILDKACFADMLENSTLCGVKLAKDLVIHRIDTTNIITFERILKSDIADKKSIFSEAFIEGGQLSCEKFTQAYDAEQITLYELLHQTPYAEALSRVGKEFTLMELERVFDEAYLSLIKAQKYMAFGAEVICSYLVNTVFEVKNARIILAALALGLPNEKIRERVRF